MQHEDHHPQKNAMKFTWILIAGILTTMFLFGAKCNTDKEMVDAATIIFK